jgi:hypothetical protein
MTLVPYNFPSIEVPQWTQLRLKQTINRTTRSGFYHDIIKRSKHLKTTMTIHDILTMISLLTTSQLSFLLSRSPPKKSKEYVESLLLK